MTHSNPSHKIPSSFFQKDDVVALSRSLLGKYLFSCLGPENVVTGGMIIEAEAYHGIGDKASHAYNNRRTLRTEMMFAPGGVAYVYFCYGIHYLLNVVTNKIDIPEAILIRAILPEVGQELMIYRRKKNGMVSSLTSGPGSVCQALGINRSHNGIDLNGNSLWLEDQGVLIPDAQILTTPRIGVDYAGEDALKPWRFIVQKNYLASLNQK